MPIGLLFWILMLLSIVFWGWGSPWNDRGPFVNSLVLYVLLFLLGWKVFGFALHA